MEVGMAQLPGQEPEEVLDLETYIAAYAGHAKLDRLLFTASKSSPGALELEALKMAADELKQTENTTLYRDVIGRIGGRAGPQYDSDSDWATAVDRRFGARRDALDAELATARTNLVKESIRQGHMAMGDLLYGRGEVAEAFRHYMRTRDYCTAPAHVTQMCLSVVRCCVEVRNFMHVATYVQKAETTPGTAANAVLTGKLHCATALSQLAGGKYRLAARAFTSVPAEMGAAFNDVLSPGDVATYGAMCAMASFDRGDLSTRAAQNPDFREFLGLAPPEVRDALHHFAASRYGAALSSLDRLRPSLHLDLHLAEHVAPLYAAIRARALTQYASPFAALNITAMAEAFGTDEGGLEGELAALISSKAIAARIDSHSKVLYARKADQRAGNYRAVIRAGEQYLRSTKSLLLRASMVRHDLVQRPVAGERPERPDRGEGPPGRPGRHRREQRGGGESHNYRGGAGGWSGGGGGGDVGSITNFMRGVMGGGSASDASMTGA